MWINGGLGNINKIIIEGGEGQKSDKFKINLGDPLTTWSGDPKSE